MIAARPIGPFALLVWFAIPALSLAALAAVGRTIVFRRLPSSGRTDGEQTT